MAEARVRQVAERGLTTPALVFLESVRPLNYVSSQALTFFTPILSAIADATDLPILLAAIRRHVRVLNL